MPRMFSRIWGLALAAFLPASAAYADIAISNDPTQSMNCSAGLCTPTSKSAVLNITDLTNMLASSDVTIVTFIGKTKHGKPIDAYSIHLVVPLSWANSSKLTFKATSETTIDAPVTVMGPGGLAIGNYYYDPARGLHITFWDLSSSFSISSIPYTLVGDVPTLVADIAANPKLGYYALANDYDAKGDSFRKAPIPVFYGVFDGLGHSIANLTIKHGSNSCEGLVSTNRGSLTNLRLKAIKVSSPHQNYIGTFAGCNMGFISIVSADGTVSGSSTAEVGGIAGANIGNSGITVAGAAVAVTGGQAGGIVGENQGYVEESFASGSVSGDGNTGGLVGTNRGYILTSYALGSVVGNNGGVGGLAGFNDYATAVTYSIVDSYSIGTVSGPEGNAGGLVGYDPNEAVTGGYWDLETSGISNPDQGAGFPLGDASIKGLTTAQFQARLPLGFAKNIWGRNPSINNGYPYLLANPPP